MGLQEDQRDRQIETGPEAERDTERHRETPKTKIYTGIQRERHTETDRGKCRHCDRDREEPLRLAVITG